MILALALSRRANLLLKELEVLELETPEGENVALPRQEAVLRAFNDAIHMTTPPPAQPQDMESEDN